MDADTPLRLLVLVRHAEARGHSPSGDRGRDLTDEGVEAAERVGEWLLEQGVRPDVVVTSPAVRAVRTWEAMHDAGLEADDVWAEEAVYDAGVDELLETIRSVSDDVTTLVLVGHAPGVPDLAADLEDHTEDTAGEDIVESWPPAGTVVVSHRADWADFPDDGTAMAHVHLP